MDTAELTYDSENPQVWEYFKRFAFELIRKGRTHLGSKMIFERIRWETQVSGNDGFKINNNYTAYYSRKFELQFPEYKGYFELRERKKAA